MIQILQRTNSLIIMLINIGFGFYHYHLFKLYYSPNIFSRDRAYEHIEKRNINADIPSEDRLTFIRLNIVLIQYKSLCCSLRIRDPYRQTRDKRGI